MPHYTHHTYKGAHQYVSVDVLSYFSDKQMPYCTHHTYTGAHQYVCADVLSDCSDD